MIEPGPRRRTLVGLLLAAAVVMALAASCSNGGDDHADRPTAVTARPSTTATTAPTTTAPTTTTPTTAAPSAGMPEAPSSAPLPADPSTGGSPTAPAVPTAARPTATTPPGNLAVLASGLLERSGATPLREMSADERALQCVGGSLVASLGLDETIRFAAVAGFRYTDAQMGALARALDGCVPGASVAASIVGGVYTATGMGSTPSPSVVTCVSRALDGRVGTVIAETLRTSTGAFPQATMQVLDRCVPAPDMTAALEALLVRSGVTAPRSTCVARALATRVTMSELVGPIFKQPTATLEGKVTEAIKACA